MHLGILLSGITLAVGCAPLPGPLSLECEIDGMLVTGDLPLSCSNLASNVQTARALWPDIAPAGVEVHVRDVDSLVNRPPFYVIGVYSTDESVLLHPVPNITLTRGGKGLLHELLHHLEKTRTGDSNAEHMGWDENGFNAADSTYRRTALEIME